MDTAEDLEIKHAILKGHDLNERCDYDYDARKESYKGGVKGKLGGSMIGAALGAAVGAATVGVMVLSGVGVAAVPVIAGFSAAGMLYGAHEFGDVGKIAGSNAAVAEKLEFRIKKFENSKFAELKNDIADLKAEIAGKKTGQPVKAAAQPQQAHEQYEEQGCPPVVGGKPVFFKVAAIGAAVGIVAGALLAFGGVTEHLMHALGSASEPLLSKAGEYAASMITLGAFGASFGVNRDIFWQIFDKTDLLFKGIVGKTKSKEPAIAKEAEPIRLAAEKAKTAEASTPAQTSPAITTVVYEGYINYPASDTFHQDREKALAAARQAFHGLDPTRSMPH